MRSSVVCDISQRILKIGQVGPLDLAFLFTPPAKEMRTLKALFPQLKVISGTCLRTVQNFSENLTATPVKSQAIFAKRVLGSILGFNRQVLKLARAA